MLTLSEAARNVSSPVPLLVLGEWIVSRSTWQADKDFLETGVAGGEDQPIVDASHAAVERFRLSRVAEAICRGSPPSVSISLLCPDGKGY
jgi:hypothetical protein